MVKKLSLLILVVAALTSCTAHKEVAYFQNVEPSVEFEYTKGEDVTIQADDMLSIIVSSKNPELASMFNLPKIQKVAGAASGSSSSGQNELSAYTVDSKGNIEFPILGKIYIAGQTKEEVTETIKNELISRKLVNDPIVTVSLLNLNYYVLGEVANPGKYAIDKNQITILEAISTAGDLTIYGKRDKVFLTRNIGDKKITYQLDMRSQDLYTSPAFYVHQDDVIYIEPNRMRANQSTVNANSLSSISFWMSLISFMTTMTILFVN